jgi:hypothetical protein
MKRVRLLPHLDGRRDQRHDAGQRDCGTFTPLSFIHCFP